MLAYRGLGDDEESGAASTARSVMGDVLRQVGSLPVAAGVWGFERGVDIVEKVRGLTSGDESGGAESAAGASSMGEAVKRLVRAPSSAGSGSSETGSPADYAAGDSPWPTVLGLAMVGAAGYLAYRLLKPTKRRGRR